MDLKLSPALIPSFTTFNISRSYSVRIYVAAECGGKDFNIFGEYVPCTLLAKDVDESLAKYSIPLDSNFLPHEFPPPYDFVEES